MYVVRKFGYLLQTTDIQKHVKMMHCRAQAMYVLLVRWRPGNIFRNIRNIQPNVGPQAQHCNTFFCNTISINDNAPTPEGSMANEWNLWLFYDQTKAKEREKEKNSRSKNAKKLRSRFFVFLLPFGFQGYW